MKITVNNTITKVNAQRIIRTFLKQYYRGQSVDAIQASTFMRTVWGLSFDWHIFADALDVMARNKEAAVLKYRRSGLCVYAIFQEGQS